MANTFLTKTFASDSNRKTWTWSAWIKRSGLGGTQTLMTQVDGWNGNGNAGFYIISDQLTSYNFTSSLNAGTDSYNRPSRYLRDVNGWYHIVVRLDTTQSTASDRCRWYVNGEQLTDFVYANYPSLNQDCNFNGGDPHGIGSHTVGAGSNFFDGIMSHVHFADGQSLEPTVFGETDATTGEWKIKTSPSFTLGTHGFTILKDGNTVTDQSTNSNNWSVGDGTLTNTLDCPDNVFATMNPLISQTGGVAGRNNPIDAKFFNGNTTIATSVAYWTPQLGNMEMFSGKYYWEQKFEVDGTPSNYLSYIGIEATDTAGTTLGNPSGTNANGIAYGTGGVVNKSGSSQSGSWSTWTAGDIVMCAVDLDNNYIYFGKNGTWQNSGVPTSGGSGTGGVAVTTGKSYITASTIHRGGNYSINTTYSYAKSNFGNGYFGTTAVSSAGTNASGIGIFEYDVPTGFTALSTKGLNL